jgi:AraC family transcriptional regulator
LAEIAVSLESVLALRAAEGGRGRAVARVLAAGSGWSVSDVVCTSGPQDRPFEEQHTRVSIAIVTAGSFQYRSAAGREVMTPGSLLLGSPGQYFECGHEHGTGDRCLAFWYAPEAFARVAADAGARLPRSGFPVLRVPPLRSLSPLVARAGAAVRGSRSTSWEELALQMAAVTARVATGLSPVLPGPAPSAEARVTRAVRRIERDAEGDLGLDVLAGEARLSPFHFLRTFKQVTGLTPHQYVMRARLRRAAARLAADRSAVIDIALDSGFGDVSNFNRAFRAEFGTSPRAFRAC